MREGRDVTIVANLLMVHKSIQAARILEESGISAEVIDIRTLAPLDNATIFRSVEEDRQADPRRGRKSYRWMER